MSFEALFDVQHAHKNQIIEDIKSAETKIPGLVFNYPPIAVWNTITEKAPDIARLWSGSSIFSQNLYVHIPFCVKKCSFCYYSVVPNAKDDLIDQYLDALEKEAHLFAETTHANTKFDTVFIGGGTPGVLSEAQIERLFKKILSRFDLTHAREINFEFSPDTISKSKLELIKSFGVNRVSMGVQSFDAEILQKARRDESNIAKVIDQYYILCDSGIETINLDFIAGVEQSDRDSMARTLDTLFSLKRLPDQLALFTLSVRKGSINAKYINDTPEQVFGNSLDIYRYARDRILDHEYWHYSRNLFSTGKKIFKYQDNVWGHNGYVLALGASGYSHSQNAVYQNHYDMREYMQAIQNGQSPIKKIFPLSDEESLRRHLVLALKHAVFDENEFSKFYGTDQVSLPQYPRIIEALEKLNILNRKDGKVIYKPSGLEVVDRYVRLFYSTQVNDSIRGIVADAKPTDPYQFTI